MQLSDRIGRRMKLHDLHVLMAVIQAGSMSKAARVLNTTQPAVSRSIADLEDAIGVRLLDRGRHGAEPTEYGRALLDGGTAMFDDLRQAVKKIEFLADPTVGEVKVGAPDPIIMGLLPAVLDRLRRKYPGISVQVTPAVTGAQQYSDLRERKLDLYLGRITPPIEEDIHVEILFHDHIMIVAGPKSRWARPRTIKPSELADEPWVLPRPDSTVGLAIADAFRARGMRFPPKGAVWGATSLMCALLPSGHCLGTLPASLLRFGANIPRLKVLAVDLPIPAWPVGVMMLRNRTLTPAVQLFVDCAREVVKPIAGKQTLRQK
ncbi:MAG TPA: LysR family transcriptional regulator [Xanthobacteraceae bacterium]